MVYKYDPSQTLGYIMILLPYNASKDKETINYLVATQGKHWLLAEGLPEHGLIAYNNNIPVACGFLRCIEGNMAFIEGYATNSKVESGIRDKAINRITNKLLQWAKNNNITDLILLTNIESIKLRAIDFSFSRVDSSYNLLTKSI